MGAFLIAFVGITVVVGVGTDALGGEQIGESSIVGVGAPEDLSSGPIGSMRRLLSGWVKRDIDRILEFAHPSVRADKDQEDFLRYRTASFMTEQRHVVRVISVTLVSVFFRGRDQVARLCVEIETTPSFPGKIAAEGRNLRQYDWFLVRLAGRGAWIYDGGGF